MARAQVSGIMVLYVALVLLDAFLGFALYKQLLLGSARVAGAVTGASAPQQYAAYTARKAMKSSGLWVLIAAGVAALGAKVAYDAV
jgi:hypothetical protein